MVEESRKKSVRRKTQTVGRLFGDSKHNLILWCIQIQHTEGGIGDDDACVLLHMDAVYRDNWDSVFLSVLKFFTDADLITELPSSCYRI